MPVPCPICETDNPDGALECATCGKRFAVEDGPPPDVALLDGLEETVLDPWESVAEPAPPLPDLQQTQLARRDLRIVAEVVPDVERTPIEFDPGAASSWGGGVVLDVDREQDPDPRTPAPADDGVCPWCNTYSSGAVCDSCGRRRSRYLAPAAAAEQATGRQDNVRCPACFGRVQPGPRCSECGLPFGVPAL
jgi:hypothetical protein